MVADNKPARIVCAAFAYTRNVNPRAERDHARVDGDTLGTGQVAGGRVTSEVITGNHKRAERDTGWWFRWCGAGDVVGRRRGGGLDTGFACEVTATFMRRTFMRPTLARRTGLARLDPRESVDGRRQCQVRGVRRLGGRACLVVGREVLMTG